MDFNIGVIVRVIILAIVIGVIANSIKSINTRPPLAIFVYTTLIMLVVTAVICVVLQSPFLFINNGQTYTF